MFYVLRWLLKCLLKNYVVTHIFLSQIEKKKKQFDFIKLYMIFGKLCNDTRVACYYVKFMWANSCNLKHEKFLIDTCYYFERTKKWNIHFCYLWNLIFCLFYFELWIFIWFNIIVLKVNLGILEKILCYDHVL